MSQLSQKNQNPEEKMNNPVNNKSQIKILSLNCNSIYNKLPEIKQLVMEENPDMMCFCETWMKPKYIPKFKNYTAIWKNREMARGGGLGLLLSTSIQYREVTLFEFDSGVLEVQAVEVFMQDKSSLYILNLYNPSKNMTYDEIQYYIGQLGERYLIIGDFNAHTPLLNEETLHSNYTGKTLETLLLENNTCLINPINMYTYIDRSTGRMSCLDICLSTSDIAPFTQICPLKEIGSDHFVMEILVNMQPCSYKWLRPTKYKITKNSLEAFNLTYKPSEIHKPASTADIVTDIIERITESANSCFGNPSTQDTANTKKRTPWWDEDCATLIKNRRCAFKKFQKHPTRENLINYKKTTATARYKIKIKKRESMNEYISSLTHTIPQSTVWRKIKSFKSGYTPQTFPLIHNGSPVLNPYDKAEIFNNTFRIQETLTEKPFENTIKECFNKKNPILNRHITSAEFHKTLRKLKNKAPGFDKISNQILKNCHDSYKEEILDVFNQSLALGDVPNVWKFGLILPFLKANKKSDNDASYRPITLLPCMGKFLGKILQSRIEYYLESNNLLSPCQFGFRPGKSTEDVILMFTEQIWQCLNNKKACCVIYIDLKGAFDRVWRHGLLYKASQLGVVGSTLHWLSNYLVERTQAVVVHGYTSSHKSSDIGVPQGGILSPLLFNIMLHDIPKEDDIELYIFADDITIAYTGNNTDEIEDKMQIYLDKLQSWFEDWGFLVNPSKTKMQFFTRKRILKPNLTFNNILIEYVKDQRLLGVVVDAPRLTWRSHISFLITNCTKRLGIMKSLSSNRYGASFEVLRRFYKVYIRPRIVYCASSFCRASNSQKNRLNVIQNSCLRLMMGARKTSPISSLEVEASIPPLALYMEYLSAKVYLKLHYRPTGDAVASTLLQGSTDTARYNRRILDKYNVHNVKRKKTELFSPAAEWYEITDFILTDAIDTNKFEEQIKQEFPNYHFIYTDGSKQETPENSVASGFYDVQAGIANSWKLHPGHTVIAAELFAIDKALEHIDNQSHTNWVVFTDSLSSLELLSNDAKSYRDITDDIKQKLKDLQTTKCVLLHWVKSHAGVHGNEIADRVANLGHSLNKSVYYPLHKEEISNILLRNMKKHWQECWVEDMLITGKGKHLGKIRNDLFSTTPVNTGSRITDVALFRLRLGHAGLKKHLHRIKKIASPNCLHCNDEETIHHFLLDCELYEQPRSVFLWKIVTLMKKLPDFTLKLLLGGENLQPSVNTAIISALAIFLRATGRLEEL